MILDFNDLTSTEKYKVISQSVIPRPIAWIVTQNNDIINVAPFSYFTPLSSSPASVIVSIGHKEDGSLKDTLANILEHKKATICFVNLEHLENMDKTAQSLDKSESEVEKFHLKTEIIKDDFPPIIKNTQGAFFCNFLQKVELDGDTVPIILEIKSSYFSEDIIDLKLNIELQNIARVGKKYATIKLIED